jgi:hypothetical protein
LLLRLLLTLLLLSEMLLLLPLQGFQLLFEMLLLTFC